MNTQNSPVKISTERRFPLDLVIQDDPIGALYESGKAGRWQPEALLWDRFDAASHDANSLAAARRVWSRRAWIEYTGLSATPALVIRFCLERDREIDPKFFLTVRNTEEAWHVESFHRYAEVCGGYLEAPLNPAWEPLFNSHLYRDALDASHELDAYVLTHCAFVDGLEVELTRAALDNTREALAHAILGHCLADGERHADFGWSYAERRIALLDAAQRAAVVAQLRKHIESVEFAGYRCVGLASEIDASADIEDLRLLAQAGMGAITADAEVAVFVQYVQKCRQKLAALGLDLPVLTHPRIGAV